MNIIDKLERKFPRFGIPNLMKYVICVNIAGAVLGLIDMSGVFGVQIYANYLSLDFNQIFHGQVWRLITFVLYPPTDLVGRNMMINLIWFAIWALVYYHLGLALEKIWGTFRFNLFYFFGIFLVVIATLGFYLFNVIKYGDYTAQLFGYMIGSSATLEFVNETVFLAYAMMFPDAMFLMYFVIPVKAKWLGWISIALLGYQFVRGIVDGAYYGVVLIVAAVINLVIFFFFGRGKPGARGQYRERRRRQEFQRRARPVEPSSAGAGTAGRHRCAICGRTELDAPHLEFRYCSRCNGNYEYCSDHLFSHEHVK